MTDFPDIHPDAADWGLESSTSEFRSDLTNTVQHAQLAGHRWRGVITYANRGGADARRLKAFLNGLLGPSTRFRIQPPDAEQNGTMNGIGEVTGAAQTGSTLNTTGWAINQSLLFDYGDYFEVNGELKQITAPASSDGSGNATLTFTPPLLTSPANAEPIEVDDPRVTVYLENDNQARAQISAPYIYALSISVVEDI